MYAGIEIESNPASPNTCDATMAQASYCEPGITIDHHQGLSSTCSFKVVGTVLNIHQIHWLWLPQKCCLCKQKPAARKSVSSSRERSIPKPTTCAIDDKSEPQLCEQLNRSFQNEVCDSAFWDGFIGKQFFLSLLSHATPLGNQYGKGRTAMIGLLLTTLLLAPQNHRNKLSFVVNYYQYVINFKDY